jgi:hypothetical protein
VVLSRQAAQTRTSTAFPRVSAPQAGDESAKKSAGSTLHARAHAAHSTGSIWRGLAHNAAHQLVGRDARRLGDLNEFKYLNLALARFDPPNKVIRSVELLCKFPLTEPGRLPRLNDCGQ